MLEQLAEMSLKKAEQLEAKIDELTDEQYEGAKSQLPHALVVIAEELRKVATATEKKRLKKKNKLPERMRMAFKVNREGNA